jgi:Reverse transcriptase (RNA-dependent DNA polymerase)/Endonuclease-reverse transcriptase
LTLGTFSIRMVATTPVFISPSGNVGGAQSPVQADVTQPSSVSSVAPTQSTADILHDFTSHHPRALQVAHVNAQSLVSPDRLDEFKALFSLSTFDVILISESWLKPSHSSNNFQMDGYSRLRTDRTGKGGGGVAAYVHTNLKPKVVCNSPNKYERRPEFMLIEIRIKGIKLLLCVVYKPPKIGYLSDIEQHILKLLPDYQHTVIMGDFNTNLLDSKAFETIQLKTMFTACDLTILPLSPTHHTNTSHTLLDLIITNNPDRVLNYGQTSAPGLSGHDIIYLSYNLKPPKPPTKYITYRDLKNIDKNQLFDDCLNTPWINIAYHRNVDDMVNDFNSFVLRLFDKHAPKRRARVTRPPAPWLTADIRSLMTQRDAAHRQYKRTPTDEAFGHYKTMRNITTQTIRNAKIKHAYDIMQQNTTPKAMWKSIREFGLAKPKQESNNISLTLDELNEYFSSTPSTTNVLTNKLNPIENNSQPPPARDKFSFNFVSTSQVRKVLCKIKTKAKGRDDIGVDMLKLIIDYILLPLTHIINSSLLSSTYPTIWKLAQVCPLPKIPTPQEAKDYRPISILPAVSKILEHVVHTQITNYLDTYSLVNEYQSGFRKGHSTNTALLQVTDDIRQAMDKRQATILVLLDFSKAFDSVDIDTLLSKLTALHFSDGTLTWMKSYLSGRHQCVLGNDDTTSSWREVTRGVPQGSVLGPLLFSLYINDISNAILHCKYHIYADDLQLYIHSTPNQLNDNIKRLNKDLYTISKWAFEHNLLLNPSKSQAILIAYPKLATIINQCTLSPIKLNDISIPLSNSVKNLGITLDKTMSWAEHVQSVCQKVFGALHSLNRFKYIFPQKLKEKLVESLVMPHFDYCDVVYNDVGPELSRKLQKAHNSCVRYTCNLKFMDHVSPSFTHLSWLRLHDRRNVHSLGLLHRILNSSDPSYLYSRFNYLSSHHQRNTRGHATDQLVLPIHRTAIFDNSFTVSAARAWNQTPGTVRSLENVKLFKKELKSSLVSATNGPYLS